MSSFRILVWLAKPKAKAGGGDDMGRETAVARITGEHRLSPRFSRLPRQYAQIPQMAPSHGTPTRSSMANPLAPGPSALTCPTISWPGTIGSTGLGRSPSTTSGRCGKRHKPSPSPRSRPAQASVQAARIGQAPYATARAPWPAWSASFILPIAGLTL
jgi:hypothetical protein